MDAKQTPILIPLGSQTAHGMEVCSWCEGQRDTLPMEMCRHHALACEMLEALQHMCDVFGPINSTVGGKGALMQARKVIEKATQ